MSEELFTLRAAREDDMPYVNSYAYAEGMDNLTCDGRITVAVNGDDVPVGFIHIAVEPVPEAGAAGAASGAGTGAAPVPETAMCDGAAAPVSERLVAHVNPVVTTRTWRGYGVGRALMEHAAREYGELRFVARGASVPFYRALGYVDAAWEDIAPAVNDCDGCEMRGECMPQPMRSAGIR